jgi:pyridoxine kinase
VIGDDHTGVFVKPGIAEFFRDRAIPTADILTPNRFELALLVEREIAGVDDALAAAAALRRRGPRLVLVTSLVGDGGEIAILAAGNDGAFLVGTPRLPILADGAGDLTAALFLGYFLKTGDAGAALGETASAVYAVIEATTRSGQPELQIVAAQDAIVSPPRQFIARKIA